MHTVMDYVRDRKNNFLNFSTGVSPYLFPLTLFPMAGGRCVSRQFKIDSIQAGMKFSGLQLNDNSFLSIL